MIKIIRNQSEISAIHAKGNKAESYAILIPAEELMLKIKKLSKQFNGIFTTNTLGKYRLNICCDECVEIAPLSDFRISFIDKSIVFTDVEQWMESS